MALNRWITLAATENDLLLLDEITERDGDASKSATVRRLIRDEARRLNIDLPKSVETQLQAEPA